MSKHEADQSAATRIREHAAAAIAALGGPSFPGFGKHRDNETKEAES